MPQFSLCTPLPLPAAPCADPFAALQLSSHFQPIFSLAHQRVVGHEALVRARDEQGLALPPPQLFGRCRDLGDRLWLDEQLCALHLSGFAGQCRDNNWLFLNLDAESFLRAGRDGGLPQFERQLQAWGLPPQQLVIEVLENAVADDADFSRAVAWFRQQGCLLALDDFGAGHSNFDRVWQIRPEIVKLDRRWLTQAVHSSQVRRILVQMTSLLHECGALVLMEGVETAEEAGLVLEADIDFVQGFYFGRPQPSLLALDQANSAIDAIWRSFDEQWHADRHRHQSQLLPYINAIGYASVLLSAGRSMEEACGSFLELADAQFCYLLDDRGQQIGANLWSAHARRRSPLKLLPLSDAQGARWALRPYFRRALDCFGKVQVTRPYLSISSGSLCLTLSVSFRAGDSKRVLCGDVRLPETG